MINYLILFVIFLTSINGYGTPPPPPPPCNTPQCSSGTFCYSNTNICTSCPPGFIYKNNPNVGVSNVENWGCTMCSPGTISSNYGSSSCSYCNSGTYQNQYGMSSCIPCQSNQFSNMNGATLCKTCSTCTPGTWLSSVCSSTSDTTCSTCQNIGNCAVTVTCSSASNSICSTCLSGYYNINSCTICNICSNTQYETVPCTTTSNRVCNTCTNTCNSGMTLNTICGGTVNPICITCPDGTYKILNDGSSCLPCKTNCIAGYMLVSACSPTSNSFCVPCAANTYKSLNDGSSCLPCNDSCNPGYMLNQVCTSTTNPSCIACPNGKYKSVSDGSSCLPCNDSCNTGYMLNQVCASTTNPSCIACPNGKYKSVSDGSICLPCISSCNIGYMLSQSCNRTTNPSCIICQSGFYSYDGIKCLECNDNCGPGSYLTSLCTPTNNPTCNKCPEDTSNPNHYSQFITSCIPCPDGTIAAIGSASCLQCPLGTATFGNNNCTECKMGYYTDNLGSIECKPCMNGTASNINGSMSELNCNMCFPGYYSLPGASQCTPCPIGTFCSSNGISISDCIQCPMGTYNNITGQYKCTMCPNGTMNNMTNSININSCITCPPGAYSMMGSYECIPCDVGTSSNIFGASSCNLNSPGTFTNISGMTIASKCNMGYYSNISGTITCTPCPPGSFNNITGSSSINECIGCNIGMYAPTSGSYQCIVVPIGYYQNNTGQSYTIPCITGTMNNKTGSFNISDCISCIPGTYQNKTGSNMCFNCSAGYYQNLFGQSKCNPCPSGTFNTMNGSTIISDCIPCPVGTFSSIIGATNISTCIPTPLGSYTNNNGSSNYTLCSPGTFMNNTRQTSCIPCSAGSYSTLYGSYDIMTCIPSLPGFYVYNHGSNESTPCRPGTYSNTSGMTECILCLPGTYNNISGSISCIMCDVGTFNLNYGSTYCNIIDNITTSITRITSNSAQVIVSTNITSTLVFDYTCSDQCTIYINDMIISRMIISRITRQSVTVNIILGVDIISILTNNSFTTSLDKIYCTWECNTTYCICIPINNVINMTTLITSRDEINMYANPNITYMTILNTSSFTQSYSFILNNLEASVKYSYSVMFKIINTDNIYNPNHFNHFTTLSGVPTSSVQNLVKFFLGINIVEQANNEQSQLQVHWDPPLIGHQHGMIIGYNIMYIQMERTYITYGPNVETKTVPSKQFILFTNQTTIILSNLNPDTLYNITINPLTSAPGMGPGNSIILITQVSAPFKPPTPILISQQDTDIRVNWTSLSNITGVITKAWIIAEPYINVSSEVIHVPNNSTLPSLPFPNTGVRGFFDKYNVSDPCSIHIFGYTFQSIKSGNICGGFCSNICEYGTPMLDPTTILPTNDQHLFNDNYIMLFNTTDGITLSRYVPYLTMKRRFNLTISDGGLKQGGTILIGDGKINPNSNLNNTVLNPLLYYRIRLIVFTSEVLYAISDPLEINPFNYQSTVDISKILYIPILIAFGLLLMIICLIIYIRKCLTRRNNSKEITDNNSIDLIKKESINFYENDMTIYTDLNIIKNQPIEIEKKYLDVSLKDNSMETVYFVDSPTLLEQTIRTNPTYFDVSDNAMELPLKKSKMDSTYMDVTDNAPELPLKKSKMDVTDNAMELPLKKSKMDSTYIYVSDNAMELPLKKSNTTYSVVIN